MSTKKKIGPEPAFDLTDEELAICREGRSGEVFSRKQPSVTEKPKKKAARKE